MTGWVDIGAVPPEALAQERVQLHWAAQLVSAPGSSRLEPRADYAHTNLLWEPESRLLCGRAVDAQGRYAALCFAPLTLFVCDAQGQESALELEGRTLTDAMTWLAQRLDVAPEALSAPEHDLPESPLASGAAFAPQGPALARETLRAWFANAAQLLAELAAEEPGGSELRCWPHHFDLSISLEIDENGDREQARSIGVGFSPGDASYAQPYFYVTPWPYPSMRSLPVLPAEARWHAKDWTGAVLLGGALLDVPELERSSRAQQVLAEAVAVCRRLLGA